MASATVPVTYFPPATQRQFAKNRERIRGKPYERYFNGDLVLREEVLPALRTPMDTSDALGPGDLNALLEPGYHKVENGFCELPDGSAYVASHVPFPGCTGEMYRWWFWWHAVEPERYTLWYPYNHVSVQPRDRDILTRPGLSHEQRYIGTSHDVIEFIGPELLSITIRFIDPAEMGFDTSRFAAAGIVGHACARVALQPLGIEAVTMAHIVRATPDGIEQRSRYFIGHDVRLPRLGGLSVDAFGAALGLKRRMAGERVAYEQLLHDQIEFTHLAGILADLYRDFGGS
jgi:hypothetical protein